MYQEIQQTPPLFRFKAIEDGADPEKSAEAGYPVPRITTIIEVTPHDHRGGPLEFEVESFLQRKEFEASQDRFPLNWIKAFREGLEAYRKGTARPVNGTPLATYERIAKSRRELLCARYATVEELASVPDSALGEIGLDGRVLRDLARGDLQAKKDLTPVVKELADANETIRRQEEQLKKLAARLDLLEEKPARRKAAVE